MSEIYQVTIITQDEQQFTGKMARREPALVNGFVALATEDGQWLYFAPGDVKRSVYVPVPATEQPVTEEPVSADGDTPAEKQDAPSEEKGDEQEEKTE